jgi:16S rRNA (cytidine1402-2'-O)-methyltransferase
VSDPGGELVSAWVAEGGTVVPIPGASAVLAALMASWLPAPRWAFEGFLPRKGAERRERLARIAAEDRATVLFEAPEPPRGEVTIVVAGAVRHERGVDVSVELVEGHRRVAELVAEGHSRSDAARIVAHETGLPRRELFRDPTREPRA